MVQVATEDIERVISKDDASTWIDIVEVIKLHYQDYFLKYHFNFFIF